MAGWKILAGHADCGCFGAVATSPWVAFGIDAAAISLLGCLRLGDFQRQTPVLSPKTVCLASLFCGAMMLFAIGQMSGLFFQRETLAEGITVTSEYAVADPDQWLHRSFPLLPFIDIGNDLSAGDWLVLLRRDDCGDCQSLVDVLRQHADPSELLPRGTRLAMISIPWESTPDQRSGRAADGYHYGLLGGSRRWIVETPLMVRVVNGTVVDIGKPQIVDSALSIRRGFFGH